MLSNYGWFYFFPAAAAFLLWLLGTALFWKFGTERLERGARCVAAFLLRRKLFRVPLARDLVRVDLLRILAGLVLLHRTLYSAAFVFHGPDPLSVKIACAVTLLLATMFTLGIATPLAGAALLFLNAVVLDTIMRTYTLGSDVLSMMLLVFTFLPAGTSLSVDRLVIQRDLPGARLLRAVYGIFGSPTLLRAVLTKAACLVSYSLLCLYSVSLHMTEPFWLSGDVGFFVLSSSYFNGHYAFFRELLASSPIAIGLARLSMMTMLVWYFGFGLFVIIGGVFRWFAIGWAFLFFLVSTFVLQLGWLGYYEFLLLAVLFWNRAALNVRGRATLEVLYDDRCNLCDRTVRFLRRVDIFHVVALKPLSRNAELIARIGLSTSEALKDLYGHDPKTGRIWRGYDFYMEISKRLLLLWPAFAVFLLGRVLAIGPVIYRLIADRRVRWFGVCERAPEYGRASMGANLLLQGRRKRLPRSVFAAFLAIHAGMAAIFFATLPLFGSAPPPAFLSQMSHVFSVAQINVFNQQDLKMNEHWFVIRAVASDGSETLLPFNGMDGERLEWHQSDRVYFGNSIRWRRIANFRSSICFDPQDTELIQEIIGWNRVRVEEPVDHYKVEYFVQPKPRVNLQQAPYFALDDPRLTCSARFGAEGKFIAWRKE
jgi:predicted DCC family thiol-disulfide oxidoreductase YuxK